MKPADVTGGLRSSDVQPTASRPTFPSRVWLRLDGLLHRNPKVARLTDAQFRALVTTWCEGKLAQSEGEWPTVDHWRWAVGSKHAKHLDALVEAGLLEVDDDGWLRIHDWSAWQPKDATAAARAKAYRDRHRASRTVTRDDTNRTPITSHVISPHSRVDTPDVADVRDDAATSAVCVSCKRPTSVCSCEPRKAAA